jgi:hypothetical protein
VATAATRAGNPVDDTRFTKPLIRALHCHVDVLADSMRVEAAAGTRAEARDRRRQVAATWVYLSTVVAWAEDHGLVDVWLRKGLHGMPGRFTDQPTPVVRLAQAFGGLCVHPATQWLLHPRYSNLRDGTPSDAAVQALADWWAGDAPPLAYDVDKGPGSITGWLVGDLLQALSDGRRSGNALVQTPWWVCDFILDRTLVPAANEFTGEPLTLCDPTAGTGHFLIRAADYLWQWYTTGEMPPRQVRGGKSATGGPVLPPAEALRRIAGGVDGVELDPLTAAVARLRTTVYLGHLAHQAGLIRGPLRLDRIPRHLVPRVAVGDSLLIGKIGKAEYDRLHPQLADLPGAAFPLPDFAWPAESVPEPAADSVAKFDQPDLFAGVGR